MSLALKFGDDTDSSVVSGVIYFDAVTQYDKSLSGKVTEHPIEAGASISDHYISQNPSYKIKGVVSSVDFSSVPSGLMVDGESPMNTNPPTSPLIISNIGSGLTEYLPDIISQFLSRTNINVIADESSRKNYKTDIESFMKTLMTGLYWNETRKKWENKMTFCTLFDVDNNTAINPVDNLVVTSFNVSETVDSWNDLFFDMTLQRVTVVTLEKAEAPKASKSSKGTEKSKDGGTVVPTATTTTTSAPVEERATVLGKINEAMGPGQGQVN